MQCLLKSKEVTKISRKKNEINHLQRLGIFKQHTSIAFLKQSLVAGSELRTINFSLFYSRFKYAFITEYIS